MITSVTRRTGIQDTDQLNADGRYEEGERERGS